jgi:DNA-binding Xre family transcriptional regulator
MDHGKFFDLPQKSGYKISGKGFIYDNFNNNIIEPFRDKGNGRLYVILNNNKYMLDKIVLQTFVGDMDSSILYKDFDKNHCSTKNLYYDLSITKIEDFICINNLFFKRIPNFNSYYITSKGIIYSSITNKLISKTFNHNGYVVATIIDDNDFRAPRRIHRLVYETYIGKLDDSMVIDHKDGNKFNNDITNLEQVTQEINIRRALDTGLDKRKRWDVDTIHKICQLLESNYSTYQIIDILKFDISDYRDITLLIHNLIHSKLYVNITNKYKIKNYNSAINKKDRVLLEEDVLYIWNSLKEKSESLKSLSDKYKCSSSTIAKIRDGKSWKKITCNL